MDNYKNECKKAKDRGERKPSLPSCLDSKFNEIDEKVNVPENWTLCTLNQISSPLPRSIQSGPFGSSLLHSEFQEKGILAIGIDNVQEGYFSMGSQHRISPEKYKKLKKYSARSHDLLITVMSTVGRCCLVPKDIEKAIITKHVYRVTLDNDLCHSMYILNYIRNSSLISNYLYRSNQGTTRPGINGKILKKMPILLPPLEEQLEILRQTELFEKYYSEIKIKFKSIEDFAKKLTFSCINQTFNGTMKFN